MHETEERKRNVRVEQRVTSKSIDERGARFPSKLRSVSQFHTYTKVTMTNQKSCFLASPKFQYSFANWQIRLQTDHFQSLCKYRAIKLISTRVEKFARVSGWLLEKKKNSRRIESEKRSVSHVIVVCHSVYTAHLTITNRTATNSNDLYKSEFLTAVLVSERYVETLLRDISQPPDRHEKWHGCGRKCCSCYKTYDFIILLLLPCEKSFYCSKT